MNVAKKVTNNAYLIYCRYEGEGGKKKLNECFVESMDEAIKFVKSYYHPNQEMNIIKKDSKEAKVTVVYEGKMFTFIILLKR